MRHQVRLSTMAASVAVVTLAVAGCGAAGTPAGEGRAESSTGSSRSAAPVEAVEIDEEKWFREIRLEDWAANGGDPAVMQAVLRRIQESTDERENAQWFDTVIEPGPGNWITEWTTVGKEALGKADAARAGGDSRAARDWYRAASIYFTVAAYPQHRESAHEEDAYRRAKDAYEKAARLGDSGFERLRVPLEGGTFEAFLHLPKGDGPFPVVLSTGGIDVAKTQNRPLFDRHLAPAGIAMVSFDNAGFGDSKDWPADHPAMDRLHSAVVDRLREHDLIDAKRIGAVGVSYGGNTVGRLAFTDERVKAVVSVCGPVHQALDAGLEFIDNLPPQPRAALAARLDVPVGNTERLAQLVRRTSLVNQGYVGKQRTDTRSWWWPRRMTPSRRSATSSGSPPHPPTARSRSPAAMDTARRSRSATR
ncbi:alpha/beta fold hydrolase [Nonomuraea sp. KM88]|uniref:alpha/beta fold hydrolase n=1 Tax=Nonomuraea sp. KM88 TaxID=3457427 RepID=UPI003FCDDF20